MARIVSLPLQNRVLGPENSGLERRVFDDFDEKLLRMTRYLETIRCHSKISLHKCVVSTYLVELSFHVAK